jgi:transposase
LERGSFGGSSQRGDGDRFERLAGTPALEEGAFHLRSAQAHAQGEAGRRRASQGQETALPPEKKAVQPGADFELWYEDETECHLHPHLTRGWRLKGHQLAVPAPGQNRKEFIFGAVEYAHGRAKFLRLSRKISWGFLVLVQYLWARAKRTGRRIILVTDNPRIHKTKKILAFLEQDEIQAHLTVFWLPTYSPDLNLIERVWGHTRRTYISNFLFSRFDQFQAHLDTVFKHLEAHPAVVRSLLRGTQHKHISIPISKELCAGT